MITTAEASIQLSIALFRLKTMVNHEGYFLPTILVFNKGKSIMLNIKHDKIYDQKFEPQTDDPDKIYISYILVRASTPGYSGYMNEIVKKIVAEYDPDVVGAFVPCLFTQGSQKEVDKKKKSLINDPETMRVIQSFYYVREGSAKGFICVTPYIVVKNVDSEPEPDESSKVIFVDTVWKHTDSILHPVIPNPYPKKR